VAWTRFFRRRHWDDERAREIDAHVAHEIDDNIARGMNADDARTAALRRFGNVTRVREEIREMNTLGFVESLWQDLRYSGRLLRRNPTFAIVAMLTLALGTGANTAIFELVNAVRLRALPVQDPGGLVEVRIDTHDKGLTGRFVSNRPFMTEPLFRRLSESQQAFSSLLAYGGTELDLATTGESRPVQGMWVNGGYFSTLGVSARVGRVLTAADDRPGCGAPGAVLSDAFWNRQFGGNPSVVGQPISLDGHEFEIIGVTPPSFFGVEVGWSFDVALPLCAEPILRGEQSALGKPGVWMLDVIGRLEPGWTVPRARAHLAAISSGIFRATLPGSYVPEDQHNYLAFTLIARPAENGVSSLRADYATPLWVLLGATALILLISCANLANLLLARATARQREIAVRLAIGASRRRIVRQVVSESLLIAACGAAGGLLAASWLSRTLVAFLDTRNNPVFLDVRTDWRVLVFAIGIAAAAALGFGLAPALRATSGTLAGTIKAGGRGSIEGPERFGLRRCLVVLQVALSLVLIAGALLLGRTFRNLTAMDPGFRSQDVMVVSLDLRRTGVPPAGRADLTTAIVERLAGIRGVEGVAQTFIVPLSGMGWNNRIVLDGRPQPGNVNLNAIGSTYFSVLGTRLIAGRVFDDHLDTTGSEPVAIVTKTFVTKFLRGGPATGRTFAIEGLTSAAHPPYRIVGVVDDAKYGSLRDPYVPIAYFPLSQEADRSQRQFARLLVRSRLPEAQLTAAATAAIDAVDPSILVSYATLSSRIADTLISERLMATLSLCFGVLAIVIATIGLYGVMSYMVARRRSEIGIRLALGAERSHVVRMIVREAALLLGIGAAVGTALSITSGRAVAALLYGLAPSDPATLATAVGGLCVVGLTASWLPARRASRLDPTVALREE
jgi:putative ABC transport system permease protein